MMVVVLDVQVSCLRLRLAVSFHPKWTLNFMQRKTSIVQWGNKSNVLKIANQTILESCNHKQTNKHKSIWPIVLLHQAILIWSDVGLLPGCVYFVWLLQLLAGNALNPKLSLDWFWPFRNYGMRIIQFKIIELFFGSCRSAFEEVDWVSC